MDSLPQTPRTPPHLDTDLEKQEIDDVFESPSQGGTTVVADEFQAQGRAPYRRPDRAPANYDKPPQTWVSNAASQTTSAKSLSPTSSPSPGVGGQSNHTTKQSVSSVSTATRRATHS